MEEDIKTLENIKNIFLNLKYHGYINDIKKDISTDGVINAIENILKERQQDKYKIKELEEKWDKDTHKLQNALDMANADKINNYIPVSLVEEKIEEINKEDENLMYKNNIITVLQELLKKGR